MDWFKRRLGTWNRFFFRPTSRPDRISEDALTYSAPDTRPPVFFFFFKNRPATIKRTLRTYRAVCFTRHVRSHFFRPLVLSAGLTVCRDLCSWFHFWTIRKTIVRSIRPHVFGRVHVRFSFFFSSGFRSQQRIYWLYNVFFLWSLFGLKKFRSLHVIPQMICNRP